MPSLGDLVITQGGTGTGIDRMDDKTPSAWEEAYGFGLSSGVQTVSGASSGAGLELTPNMMPDGTTLRLAWTPDHDSGYGNDKTSGGDGGAGGGQAIDVTLELSSEATGMEGLNLYGGYSDISQDATAAAIKGDKEEYTVGASYAVGGFTLGYQYSMEDVAGSAADYYENNAYGVTFNVSDNLTVGYNNYKSEKNNVTAADIELEASSMQIAYTMGGMSIRVADGNVDNRNYSTTAANDLDGRTFSVSLAF